MLPELQEAKRGKSNTNMALSPKLEPEWLLKHFVEVYCGPKVMVFDPPTLLVLETPPLACHQKKQDDRQYAALRPSTHVYRSPSLKKRSAPLAA